MKLISKQSLQSAVRNSENQLFVEMYFLETREISNGRSSDINYNRSSQKTPFIVWTERFLLSEDGKLKISVATNRDSLRSLCFKFSKYTIVIPPFDNIVFVVSLLEI